VSAVAKTGGVCAYCGAPEETRDQVPPRGIFASLLRLGFSGNLITVPSCKACNNTESKNDEYFRQVMVALETIEGATVPSPVVETIRRSAKRAEKEGVRTPLHLLARTARKVWVWAADSSQAQLKTAVDIEWPRVRRTALRIARGLYRHHTGHNVPDHFDVAVYSEGERANFTQEQQDFWHEMAMDTLKGTKKVVHPEAFMYAINAVAGDPRVATLVFVIYKKVIFLCMVTPPDEELDALVEQSEGK
jgi:hypothetical protein